MFVEKNACIYCGKEAFNICERCGDDYCSIECQKLDWGAHRYICMPKPNLVAKFKNNVKLYDHLPELVEFKNDIEDINTWSTCVCDSDNSSYSSSSEKIEKTIDGNKSVAAPIQNEQQFMKYFKKRALNILAFQNNINIIVDVDRFAGENVELFILDNSHINNGYLKCILANDLPIFGKMDEKINQIMKETHKPISFIPHVGLYCMVKSVDGGWYRAICSSFNRDNTISVLFMDFGYEENVTLSQIYQLDNKLAYPCISVTCHIEGIPSDESDELYRKNFFTKLGNIFLPFSKVIFDKVVPDQKMKITKCYSANVLGLSMKLK